MEYKYSYIKPKHKYFPLFILDGEQYIFNYLNQILFEKMMKNYQKLNLVITQFNLFYAMEFLMKIALLM